MAAKESASVAESARISALREHWILDTDPEQEFDDLAILAAQCCRTPFAAISFIDEDREWVKASHGSVMREIPRTDSLAAQAIRQKSKQLFLVLDARDDTRFADKPLVRDAPFIRFYVAVPLVCADGHVLGVLSVFDDRPRLLDDAQAVALQALGRQVVALLELRRKVQGLTDTLSARIRAEENVEWQAGHDSLTGLPNRALFLKRVDNCLDVARKTFPRGALADTEEPQETTEGTEDSGESLDRASGRKQKTNGNQVALLFVDLDRFKRINDTLGHAAGDSLLREVAARFSGCLRPEDTLARLGGDEFTVLLPEVPGPTYATSVCQMLLRTLRRPIVIGNQELQIGASIGISMFPRDGEDAQTLLKHADIAMYQAKEKGGYQAYSRRMNADGYQRLIEEGELRRAIERSEITVLYQPVINAITGEVQGMEALARWKHPERGQVPPAHFISLAEQADLIVPLGELVLQKACQDVATWRQRGMTDLRVAVNISARQLSQPRLGEFVEATLAENGLPGSALDIELTETALCGGGDGTPMLLQHLRSLGIRLFVDDFGTGYSSLVYLRRFAVDVIKIDRAFVAGLGQDTTDEAIVRALIEMAHALNLQVVAEGVETEVQRDVLRNLGCDLLQGFLYSRPIPTENVRALLQPGGRRLRPGSTLYSRGDDARMAANSRKGGSTPRVGKDTLLPRRPPRSSSQ